jgi:hypothetical protein
MAIVNPGNASTSPAVRVLDQNGNLLANSQLMLSAHQRLAFALADQLPATRNVAGVVEFRSTEPGVAGLGLAGLGLRFNPQGPFTSIPVLTANDAAGAGRQWLSAQIADGGGWQTTMTLVNGGPATAQALLNFYGPDGTPQLFSFRNLGASSALQGTVQPSAVGLATTAGTNGNITAGWMKVSGSRALGGVTIFRQRVPGRPDFEAGSPLVRYPVNGFLLPFDNTQPADQANPFVTAVALVNPSSFAVLVSVNIRDEDGNVIASGTLPLNASGQAAFALADKFSGILNRRGVVEFSCLTGVSGLGLRFNPQGAFTSLPIIAR